MLQTFKILLLCLLCSSLVACIKSEHLIRSGSLATLTKGDSPTSAKVKINGTPSIYYQSKKMPTYSVQKFSISNGVQVDPYYLTYKNEQLEY